MNRWIVLITVLVMNWPLFGQNTVSFEHLDKRLSAEAIPLYYHQGELYSGTTVDSFEQGQKVYYYDILKGEIQSHTAFEYTGQQVRDFNYENGLLEGKVTSYFGNGQKYFEDHYKKGLREGRQYGWYKDGSPRYVIDCMGGVEIFRTDYPKPAKKEIDEKD